MRERFFLKHGGTENTEEQKNKLSSSKNPWLRKAKYEEGKH